jgi:hypothetical protein
MKDHFGNDVTFASRIQIDAYPTEQEKVVATIAAMAGLKAEGIWVSDESHIYDFPLEETGMAELSAQIGVTVEYTDTLLTVCERLHNLR